MHIPRLATFVLVLALAPSVRAQAINIDVNDFHGTPSSGFGAAAAQPGVWNNVPPTIATTPLVDLAGAATGASISVTGVAAAYQNNNAGTSGDDQALMDDISNPSPGGATWTISGLQPGAYILYTYGWAPDNPVFVSQITVTGSIDGAQTVGGAWPNGYVQGVTHAKHRVNVVPGGTIAMFITAAGGGSFGSLNGFQVVPDLGTFSKNCFPGTGGVIACPCGQPANPAGGCANFGATATTGAVLDGAGNASLAADTLVLTTSNHRTAPAAGILNVFFASTGTSQPNGVANGAGVRCYNQVLKRLYTGQTTAGTLAKPGMGDPSVSARSAALGSPISAGQTRHYFNLYRDQAATAPSACNNTASNVNVTNAGSIQWSP